MKVLDLYEYYLNEEPENRGLKFLLPFVEDALGVKASKWIGTGTMSNNYELADGRVLKLTYSTGDGNGLAFSMEHPELPVIKVFDVFKIDGNKMPDDVWPKIFRSKDAYIYGAIAEKLDTSGMTWNEADYLIDWFEKNTDYVPNDILPRNIGRNSNGDIVYLDPKFRRIPSYKNKIRELELDYAN